jgi:hypothetical protein
VCSLSASSFAIASLACSASTLRATSSYAGRRVPESCRAERARRSAAPGKSCHHVLT